MAVVLGAAAVHAGRDCAWPGDSLVAGGVGADMENNVVYQEFALLLALLIFAFMSCRFFHAKFSATRALPRFGTAGKPLALPCAVEKFDRDERKPG